MKKPLIISVFCCMVFALTMYGGIRSPDGEVVYRVTESLVTEQSFSVSQGLEAWEGFGLVRGLHGKRYAWFGPAQSIFSIPMLITAWGTAPFLARLNIPTPISHYLGFGIADYLSGKGSMLKRENWMRFSVSFFNVLIAGLSVMVFWVVIQRLVQDEFVSGFSSILFGLGTLIWPYSGTYFSELLALLFILVSFYFLLNSDSDFFSEKNSRHPLYSGIFLGLAIASHITSILFLPFFFFYLIYNFYQSEKKSRLSIENGGSFLGGCGFFLTLLGFYNYYRFGNFLETGRSVAQDGQVYSPVELGNFSQGFYGLMLSGGKGFIWFCPVILFGIIFWPMFHKKHPKLSNMLALLIGFRIFFLSNLSNWHGGFCLGPRLLLLLIPFFLIPFAVGLKRMIDNKKTISLGVITATSIVFVCQQFYFCLGEIFSFYHVLNLQFKEEGINLFENDFLYQTWSLTPLMHLHEGLRAPYFLRFIPISNLALFWAGSIFIALVLGLSFTWKLKKN